MTLDPPPLWTPTPDRIAEAHITRFRDHVADSRGLELPSYQTLWEWSVSDLADFWAAVWEFFALDSISGYDTVLAEDTMPGARWFTGSRLNFASYVLSQGQPDAVAVVATDETGAVATWTRGELAEQTAALASTLAGVGVEPGDVVVGYLPNIGEAVVAFLAVASLGAIWSSVGQDYAPRAVIDRFSQLDPKVLVTSDDYRFNGRTYDRTVEIGVIQAGLPTLEHTIVVNRFDGHRAEVAGQTSGVA
jgi:acetoacetyl-CoA synthetase